MTNVKITKIVLKINDREVSIDLTRKIPVVSGGNIKDKATAYKWLIKEYLKQKRK